MTSSDLAEIRRLLWHAQDALRPDTVNKWLKWYARDVALLLAERERLLAQTMGHLCEEGERP